MEWPSAGQLTLAAAAADTPAAPHAGLPPSAGTAGPVKQRGRGGPRGEAGQLLLVGARTGGPFPRIRVLRSLCPAMRGAEYRYRKLPSGIVTYDHKISMCARKLVLVHVDESLEWRLIILIIKWRMLLHNILQYWQKQDWTSRKEQTNDRLWTESYKNYSL